MQPAFSADGMCRCTCGSQEMAQWVRVWDEVTQTYYKGAMGIILVYDWTDEQTFNNIRNWIKQIETHAAKDVAKLLVGNKCDWTDEKVISTE